MALKIDSDVQDTADLFETKDIVELKSVHKHNTAKFEQAVAVVAEIVVVVTPAVQVPLFQPVEPDFGIPVHTAIQHKSVVAAAAALFVVGTLVFLHNNSVDNWLLRKAQFEQDLSKGTESIQPLSDLFGTFRIENILGIPVVIVPPLSVAGKVSGTGCTRNTLGYTAGMPAGVVSETGWYCSSSNLHFPRTHKPGSVHMACGNRGTRKHYFRWALRSADLIFSGTFLPLHYYQRH